jgi:L-fuconolactonase
MQSTGDMAPVDIHAHVFGPETVGGDWPGLASVAAGTSELLEAMAAAGVERALLVPFRGNTDYVGSCARANPERLAYLASSVDGFLQAREQGDTSCVGTRLTELGRGDETSAEELDHYEELQVLQEAGGLLSFFGDLAQQRLLRLSLRALPELVVLVNHFGYPREGFYVDQNGRPRLSGAAESVDRELLGRFAEFTGVHVAFSGLYAVSTAEPPYSDLQAHAQFVRQTFGANRIIWGSDYPWIRNAPGYAATLGLVRTHFEGLSEKELALVAGGNAVALLDRVAQRLAITTVHRDICSRWSGV